MDYDELGELVGHISIGLEIVNSLWQKLSTENADAWKTSRRFRKTSACISCT